MTDEINTGRMVKIIRNGERFWVRNVREMDGRLYGQVDNDVVMQPFTHGEIIEILADEIIDVWTDDQSTRRAPDEIIVEKFSMSGGKIDKIGRAHV